MIEYYVTDLFVYGLIVATGLTWVITTSSHTYQSSRPESQSAVDKYHGYESMLLRISKTDMKSIFDKVQFSVTCWVLDYLMEV